MSLVGKIGRWMEAVNFLAALRDDDALATASLRGALSTLDFAKLATVPVGSGIVVDVVGDEMDLVGGVGQVYQVVPAVALRLVRFLNLSLWLTTVGGTRSAVGTFQIGANTAIDDLGASQNFSGTSPNCLNGAQDQLVTLFGGTQINFVRDLSAHGVRAQINSAMTGVAPVCKARITGTAVLYSL